MTSTVGGGAVPTPIPVELGTAVSAALAASTAASAAASSAAATLAGAQTLSDEFTSQLASANQSATLAQQSAVQAASSVSAVAASATNAATSATTATGAATTATTAATTATTQAGIATTQAGIATTQAGNAATSATGAASSATAAAASAAAAAVFDPSSYPTKANNLSDLANIQTARANLRIDQATTIADTNATITNATEAAVFTSLTAARTLTLAAASTMNVGQAVFICDESGNCSSTNTITIAAAGSDTINNASTYVLNTAYSGVILMRVTSTKYTVVRVPTTVTPARWDVVAEDQKASGTAGGGAAVGYQTRTLNTLVVNTVSAILSSNVLTLPAGTWEIEWETVGYNCNILKAELWQSTGPTFVAAGMSAFASVGAASRGRTQVTIGSSTGYIIRMLGGTTSGTNGLGYPSSSGQVEVYSRLCARKLA